MADDVVVKVGADASSLASEVSKARRELGKLDDALDDVSSAASRVNRSTGDAAKGTEKFKRKAEDLNKAGQVLGGELGALGGKLDAFASLANGTAGAVGAIGLVAGGAAVAGMLAFGGAIAAAGSHIYQTTRDINDLAEGMTAFSRGLTGDNIDAVVSANVALQAMDESFKALSVNVTANFAPAITTASDTLSGIGIWLAGAAEEGYGLGNALEYAAAGMVAIGGPAGQAVVTNIRSMGEVLSVFREEGRKAREAQEEEIRNRIKTRGDEAAKSMEEAKQRAMDALSAVRSAKSAMGTASEIAPSFDFAQTASDVELGSTPLSFNIRVDPADVVKEQAAELVKVGETTYKTLQGFSEEAAQNTDISWSAAIGSISDSLFGMTQQLIESFNDTSRIAELETQIQSDSFKRLSKNRQMQLRNQLREEKQAAHDRWAASQAIALAQAAVNAALTITQSFAQLGPIAGAVAAVAAGASVAAQIAIIASTKPRFHVGGIGPDEYMSGSAVYRTNERNVTLTRQGIDALGGPSGIGSINATGKAGGGDIYLIVDGEPRKARRFAGAVPNYGRRMR